MTGVMKCISLVVDPAESEALAVELNGNGLI